MLLDRRAFALNGLFAALPGRVQARSCAAKRVLFVCPAGSVKSAIAREELRRLARFQKVPIHVESRGVHPENHISPLLAERLKRDKINPLSEPLEQFVPNDAAKADVVVAFDEASKAPGLERARKWSVASWNTQYDDAKSDTLENIERLLHEIKQHPCRSS